MLERLGMRAEVTRSAVLESARSIEQLAAQAQPEAALARARALLRYVDQHAAALPAPTPEGLSVTLSAERAPPEFEPGPEPDSDPAPRRDTLPDSSSAEPSFSEHLAFGEQLRQIAWLPVLTSPPHEGVPWRSEWSQRALSRPEETRPIEDMWLISSNLRLLDGELRSEFVLSLFRWNEPPRAAAICAQLVELGAT